MGYRVGEEKMKSNKRHRPLMATIDAKIEGDACGAPE